MFLNILHTHTHTHLGIVHTIDTSARCFYIRTPVPIEQLQHVNILLKGHIEIPPFLFFVV
jgi:polynucleotide 5'-kinase involved in rRNA processing